MKNAWRGNSRLTPEVLVTVPLESTWTSGPSQEQSKYALMVMFADEAWKFLEDVVLREIWCESGRKELLEPGAAKRVEVGQVLRNLELRGRIRVIFQSRPVASFASRQAASKGRLEAKIRVQPEGRSGQQGGRDPRAKVQLSASCPCTASSCQCPSPCMLLCASIGHAVARSIG